MNNIIITRTFYLNIMLLYYQNVSKILFYGDMITGEKIGKVVIPLNNLYVTILQTLSLHSDSRHFIFIVLHISFFLQSLGYENF